MKFLIIGLFSFILLGCGSVQKVEPIKTIQKSKPETPNYDAFGQKIEDSLNEGTDFFESRFDSVTFMKRIAPNVNKKRFDDMVIGFNKRGASAAFKAGDFSYLRTADYNQRKYLFFRLIEESGYFIYFGLELNEKATLVDISDVFFFNIGAALSETARDFFDVAGGNSSEFLELLAITKRFLTEPEKALEIWSLVPKHAKEVRSIHAGYINALASSAQRVEYEKQFFSYEEKYPTHYSTLFLALDFYYLMKRFPNCYEAIDTIEDSFGRDPYLDVIRAGVLEEEGRIEEAYKMVTKSIDEDPSISSAWESALGYSLKLKKFEDARIIFETLSEAGYEWDIEVLKSDVDYKEFMESKEGVKFLKSLEKSKED